MRDRREATYSKQALHNIGTQRESFSVSASSNFALRVYTMLSWAFKPVPIVIDTFRVKVYV